MNMHNPPHPGEFIHDVYMEPFQLSCRYLASQLDVAPSTLNRILQCRSAVSTDMALRLSKALGRNAESWLTMQDNYNLWQARQHANLKNVHKIHLKAA